MKRILKTGVLAMLVALPIAGHALAADDITVKLENTKFVGKQKEIQIKPSHDYQIKGKNVELKKNINYTVKVNGSSLALYENGKDIPLTQDSSSLVLLAPTQNALLTLKQTAYLGDVELKDESGFVQAYNTLDLEDYLKGVVPYEMSNEWGKVNNKGMEALKAQAVSARSYVLANNYQHAAFIKDTTENQVYGGYKSAYAESNLAVEETEGEYLTYGGKVIATYYYSSNGGFTETNENVWSGPYDDRWTGTKLAYLSNREDTYDAKYTAGQPESFKTFSIKQTDLLAKLKSYQPIKEKLKADTLTKVEDVKVVATTNGKRAKSIQFTFITKDKKKVYYTMKATNFRALMGNADFRSTYINKIEKTNDSYIFRYVGNGHGVGMSQWGAYYRSKAGISYDDILSFYYPNTVLETPKVKIIRSSVDVNEQNLHFQYDIDKPATVFVDILNENGTRVSYVQPHTAQNAGTYSGDGTISQLNAGSYKARIVAVNPTTNQIADIQTKTFTVKPKLPSFSNGMQTNTSIQTVNAYTNRNKTEIAKKIYAGEQMKIIARYGNTYEVEHAGDRVFIDKTAMKASKHSYIRITVDGYQLAMDEKPRLVNGRTVVPIRFVGNGLGMKVKYDAKTKKATLTKGTKTIVLTVGKNIAHVNGKAVKLDSTVRTYNGRIMLPIRFVSEQMGAYVDWDAAYKMIWIKQK